MSNQFHFFNSISQTYVVMKPCLSLDDEDPTKHSFENVSGASLKYEW